MKSFLLIIFIVSFASSVLAEKKPCTRKDQSYNHGEIITGDNDKRYICNNGTWKPLDDAESNSRKKSGVADLSNDVQNNTVRSS